MAEIRQAVKVTDRVYWVGAIDWSLSEFHGYSTRRGTTYNAYLVLGDKTVLVDTVKKPFFEEMLERVASVVEPSKVDYIISNHSEMDHSGSLPLAIEAVRPEKVFASRMGRKALREHFGLEVAEVKDRESLSLGNLSINFLETKMLHWPDSMFSYLVEEKLLFSQDAFGMHLAASERFADEIEPDVLEQEAAKYYANILLPFSPLVTRLIDRVASLGIGLNVVAPDHGPVWRRDFDRILGWYGKWAAQKPSSRLIMVYDSMWHSTAMMAAAAAEGAAAAGASVKVQSLHSTHRSDVMTEILDAGGLMVGSPTMNNGLYPTVADFLAYAKGLKPRNLVGAAFGSFGWSGEAPALINDVLSVMKVDLPAEPLKVQYVPDAAALDECRGLGALVAEKMLLQTKSD